MVSGKRHLSKVGQDEGGVQEREAAELDGRTVKVAQVSKERLSSWRLRTNNDL